MSKGKQIEVKRVTIGTAAGDIELSVDDVRILHSELSKLLGHSPPFIPYPYPVIIDPSIPRWCTYHVSSGVGAMTATWGEQGTVTLACTGTAIEST